MIGILISALCVGKCIMSPVSIRGTVKKHNPPVVYKVEIPNRKPDVVSVRAKLEDYYRYDRKTKKWVWSGE